MDVRVIAATNRDIEQAIRDKQFREDLFYRLNVVPIYLPPLRERAGDIALLTNYFIASFNREFKKTIKRAGRGRRAAAGVAPLAGQRPRAAQRHRAGGAADAERVPDSRRLPAAEGPAPGSTGSSGFEIRLPATGVDMEEVERALVVQALELARGNQTKAAKLLNLSRDQLRYRMEKFGML